MSSTIQRNFHVQLTAEQLDAFGDEMDAIRQRVVAELGEIDANYIRRS